MRGGQKLTLELHLFWHKIVGSEKKGNFFFDILKLPTSNHVFTPFSWQMIAYIHKYLVFEILRNSYYNFTCTNSIRDFTTQWHTVEYWLNWSTVLLNSIFFTQYISYNFYWMTKTLVNSPFIILMSFLNA